MSSIDSSQAASTPKQQYSFASIASATDKPTAQSGVPHARLAKFAARQPDPSINSFCGAVAGVASGIVTCPLDVIKTKLQGQGGYRPKNGSAPVPSNGPAYRGMFGTASVIWRQDGLRGMYRGLGPMLLGYLPTWAVYMSVYGAAKDHYYTKTGKRML